MISACIVSNQGVYSCQTNVSNQCVRFFKLVKLVSDFVQFFQTCVSVLGFQSGS